MRTYNWRQIPGQLIHVTVYGDILVGVNRANEIWYGSSFGTSPNWRRLPGELKQITTDGKQLCGVNHQEDIWCADENIDTHPNWRLVSGNKLKYIEFFNGRLIGVNTKNDIFIGNTKGEPKWHQIKGKLSQISFDGLNVCGINSINDVYCANDGFTRGTPNWFHVSTPSSSNSSNSSSSIKMHHVQVNAGYLFGTSTNENHIFLKEF
jgi:hypothetical protein